MDSFRTILLGSVFFAGTTLLSIAETNMVSSFAATNAPSGQLPLLEKSETTGIIDPVVTPPSGIDRSHLDWLGHRVDAIEKNLFDCYSGLKTQIDNKIGFEVRSAKKDAEIEYTMRYCELKREQSNFLTYLSILVAILGVAATVAGIVLSKITIRTVKNSTDGQKNEFEKLKNDMGEQVKVTIHTTRAEMYFQIARSTFEQYRSNPIKTILTSVVKALSHCIESNVLAKDGDNLLCAISFLETVMEKAVDPTKPYATALVRDRIIVKNDLKTWTCRASILELRSVMETAQIEKEKMKSSIEVLRNVFGRFGSTDDIE